MKWRMPDPVTVPEELRDIIPGDGLFGELLYRRGIKTRAEALAFLYLDHYTQSDPFDLPGMAQAVDLIMDHIARGNLIGIWGDFDADGQTATAILYEGLRRLTPDVIYRIPVRSRQSHGVSIEGVSRFAEQGVGLMITCDTGVSETDAIEAANHYGITTIITDHHSLPEILPDAAVVINSQLLPEGHAMRPLSGAGVAFKVIQAIYTHKGVKTEADDFLDLAAIGTVADLVPLTGESRYIVKQGLLALQSTTRPGLLALFKAANIKQASLTEDTISYSIAPRLNALSRIGDANPMIELLTTTDEDEALRFVQQIEGSNHQRKQMTDSITSAANNFLLQNREILEKPVVILQNEEWPAGVTGVVASHLSDLYHKPVVIIAAPEGKDARGSARSIEGVNIIEALSANQEYLIRFGGHPQAAGFAIKKEHIPLFMLGLQKTVAEQISGGVPEHDLVIDAFVPLEIANNPQFLENLDLFRPFGTENPGFNLVAPGVMLTNVSRFGKEMSHRRLEVQSVSGTKHSVIWWNGAKEPPPPEMLDLMYQISGSSYQGGGKVQISYIASRPQEDKTTGSFSARPSMDIADRRDVSKPVAAVLSLLREKEAVIFGEGILHTIPGLVVKNRLQVSQCDRLILLTPPADTDVLKTVLEKVKPSEIIVFASYPGLNSKIKFMKYLSGQLLKAIQTHNGRLNIASVAAESGHREKTVLKAVSFLASKTSLEIQADTEEEILISNFGKPLENNQRILSELDHLLEETKAFRQYFLRANLLTFFSNLENEMLQSKDS